MHYRSLQSHKDTVNVGIFTCINFCIIILRKSTILRGFIWAFFIVFPLNGIVKLIFMLYIFLRIFFRKCELHENMYSAKMYTFTVTE